MNADRRELFRLAILRVLDANRTRFGLGKVAIGHHLGTFGFPINGFSSAEDFYSSIADEIQYLENKHLVEEALKVVSKENRAWRITDQGLAFVDQNC